MKKTVGILFIISSVLLLFCGCFTTGSLFEEHHVYYSKGVSSKFSDREITRDDVVFIISNMDEGFRSNRFVEETLSDKFSKYGIKCVLTTDKLTGTEDNYTDLLYSLLSSTNHQYRMFINWKDIYTYKSGGGISSLETDVSVYWKNEQNKTLSMSISTNCRENKLLHYSDTLEDCLESLCDEIVKQYMKYCQ